MKSEALDRGIGTGDEGSQSGVVSGTSQGQTGLGGRASPDSPSQVARDAGFLSHPARQCHFDEKPSSIRLVNCECDTSVTQGELLFPWEIPCVHYGTSNQGRGRGQESKRL